MTKNAPPLAAGARVEIRSEEWLVRSVESTSSGGFAVECVGLSELVNDREAIFLTEHDQNIKVLDPADTRLVADETGGYVGTRLFIESFLDKSPPTDPPGEEKGAWPLYVA